MLCRTKRIRVKTAFLIKHVKCLHGALLFCSLIIDTVNIMSSRENYVLSNDCQFPLSLPETLYHSSKIAKSRRYKKSMQSIPARLRGWQLSLFLLLLLLYYQSLKSNVLPSITGLFCGTCSLTLQT